ncbi:dehydrogenase [Lithospermum erythrorhizon]|uniref:CASP-like protein n=1 Tax=Lithospermum erythrorhizon TaxID=34254 RepID=A0AAV3PPL4_LITER
MGETETQAVLHHGEKRATAAPEAPRSFAVADVVLRFLLFAAAVISVLVMVTSNEKKTFSVPLPTNPITLTEVTRTSKWRYSPAFVYFVVALSVAGIYSIITFLLALLALMKRSMPTKLLSHIIIMDVLLLGIVSAATGTAGAVGYLGLKGNTHTSWAKICNRYHKFCRHIGGSIVVSLIASVILVFLVLLNIYALSKRIPK